MHSTKGFMVGIGALQKLQEQEKMNQRVLYKNDNFQVNIVNF